METPDPDAGAIGFVTFCPDAAALGPGGHPLPAALLPAPAHPRFLLREWELPAAVLQAELARPGAPAQGQLKGGGRPPGAAPAPAPIPGPSPTQPSRPRPRPRVRACLSPAGASGGFPPRGAGARLNAAKRN